MAFYFGEQERQFTPLELARYDGTSGMPAYIGFEGVVYGITNRPLLTSGNMFGTTPGRDMTAEFNNSYL